MKRLARLFVVLSAAACGGTGVASAHVDYVTDAPAGSESFAELLGGVAAAPLNLLLLAGGGPVERVPLAAGTQLAYTLGERRCAGALTAEGDASAEGTVVDVRVPFADEAQMGFDLAGQVTVDLDVNGEHVSVGGWGAIVEDIEGTRLTLVDGPPP